MATPTRTCVGCRQRGPATSMVRLAMVDGVPTPWAGRRPAGRGASIHPSEACVQQAVRSGAFSRAFKSRIPDLEATTLWRRIDAHVTTTTPRTTP